MVVSLLEIVKCNLESKLAGNRTLDVKTLISNFTQIKQQLFPFDNSISNPDIKKILIAFTESETLSSAIEVHLYKLEDKVILYVSKVDSTGFGKTPSPISIAVESIIEWSKLSFKLDIWLHIFARAQNAYIFPNSEKNGKKRVLTDTQLQRWWKRTLDDLKPKSKWLFLPGYTQDEAAGIIKCDNNWIYGNPHQSITDLKDRKLSSLIPYFDDDPKSRFLDELANSTEALDGRALKKPRKENTQEENADYKRNALDRTSIEEFWERLGFRQECASGRVTGFFFLHFKSDDQDTSNENKKDDDYGISIELFHRIHDLLTNSDFISLDSAKVATTSWNDNINSLIDNPKLYISHQVIVNNPEKLKVKENVEAVKPQVLTVRKKKRPASEM
ncbi:hypothetical protein WALSEDRAFT_57405 [Wallemia mellicola CBS 633.66]|uniref:histone acetyltransferase n=1 Tax=Wallemia mellicola (strain ATCC MYA-4683 / CBS 633.66) TaxID=671144 RepID=I4YCB8_WALMC|nr:hypothetical protein WALSEDRAFT_57405 [Wallemia mellicola CBS 633.66]EIM21610.1 hypothetical protein WALSEDRAFT_57405 [Wallemia mellicola CBS 633.66]|eukprot:XP_006958305.1 hypothetical protein WALSEDRAFT_57405 [Wallemia mellicola CBS 633.66]